jgi:hypothetical protein
VIECFISIFLRDLQFSKHLSSNILREFGRRTCSSFEYSERQNDPIDVIESES